METISNYIVFALAALILLFLAVLSVGSTAMITLKNTEHTFLLPDDLRTHFCTVFLFVLFLFLTSRLKATRHFAEHINTDERHSDRIRWITILLIGVLSVAFIFIVKNEPVGDPLWIYRIAEQWIRRDYSSFDPGSYLNVYPHQLGLILFSMILQAVFGLKNYLVFRLINVLALCFIYKNMTDISDLAGNRPVYGFFTLLSGVFFLPGIFYTTFVYGNLIGLSLSLGAVKRAVSYAKKERISDAALSILCMILALIAKSNYLIFLIGIVLYLILVMIRKPKMKTLLYLMILIAAVSVRSLIVEAAVYSVTGHKTGEGSTMWSYVAMGLSENEIGLYNGWHNAYDMISYKEHNGDVEAQKEECLQKIRERILCFASEKKYAVKFFIGKEASQWNNPEFQALWINRVMTVSEKGRSEFAENLLTERAQYLFTKVFDEIQLLILLGALLGLILKKEKDDLTFLFATIFIGGFLFHTIWEAKAQYTFMYFLLLLPISVEGFGCLIQKENFYDRKEKRLKLKNVILCGLLLTVMGLILIAGKEKYGKILNLDRDIAEYEAYLEELTEEEN
ncbi:MAG: hypothetical protein K6F53_02115 [Lachnospiraceae bacterium]|nr:hypothetical protein [Lachnospiraceae bacterium]